MSSSLNLSPDITVIGVQAGIFLANMFAVKKLMLEPYLKVRAAREKSTGGSQGDASSLLDKAKELDQQIAVKMRDAHKQASETRESIKSSAQSKRNELIQKAEATSKKDQADLQNEIHKNLEEEKSKRTQTINEVSDELVKLATN